MISQVELRERLNYNPATGIFRWRRSNGRRAVKGKPAGHQRKSRYVFVGIDGKYYAAHRLAWFYVYGEWPKQIDHEDTNKTNNRFDNLRKANNQQQSANRKCWRHGECKGVTRIGLRFRARIRVNNSLKHLGYFYFKGAAAAAYRVAAVKHFGEFART